MNRKLLCDIISTGVEIIKGRDRMIQVKAPGKLLCRR